ncbi:hypothetical protein L484_003439 [Morus notabilis]|uniref:Uncharacterized protein n=1 Tax=Morus notabilis TaxID=981085 RepID=W9QU84_9ROSA|nr:hypothetical protein L484_003439 [Morus notabilis]
MNCGIEASIPRSSLGYYSFSSSPHPSDSPTKKSPLLISTIGDSTMTGKAKPKKHTAEEIAAKIDGGFFLLFGEVSREKKWVLCCFSSLV